MEFVDKGSMGDGFESLYSTGSPPYICRICHEEEESSTSMEAPCSCSGTLKFAHRRCTQRWCDEKGSNLCEICLQKFEPGYAAKAASTAKAHFVDVAVTIRGSLEVPRHNYEAESRPVPSVADERPESGHNECSVAANRRASMCQLVLLTFTVILLLKHLIALQSASAEDYAFTLATVFLLRAVGILLPLFCIMRLIAAIHQLHGEEEDDDLEHQRNSSTGSF